MSDDLKTPPEAGIVELVSGIITDVQVLINQQMALFQYEIKAEISHARDAGFFVSIGLAILVMGGILLCGMLVHLLAWMAPDLPLWACYGIIGAPVTALGGILCLIGVKKLRWFDTPTAEPVQDFKEKADG